MRRPGHVDLSRRERQIMDIAYQLGQVTAAEVQKRLPDPPSYSAVRAMLRVLEEKGHLEHRQDGPRYVYRATVPVEAARRSAVKRVLKTFFDNSLEEAVATLLDVSASNLSKQELDRLAHMIEEARREGR
ncbi:MAG: BlaI/MecI/CopY family transcriptional regulator [Gemmatimonadota bacterium]